MWELEAQGCLLHGQRHPGSSLPSDVRGPRLRGSRGRPGGQARRPSPAYSSSLNAVRGTAGQSGGLHSVGRASETACPLWKGEPPDLASLHGGLPFLSTPHPEAEWSPGQSTKWLFATEHLEVPEGGSGPICQSRLLHSHPVTHTALRRLRQRAWPNRAQRLSLHLRRVKGESPWLLQKRAEGGEAGNGRVSQAWRKKREEGRQGLARPLSRPDGCPWK